VNGISSRCLSAVSIALTSRVWRMAAPETFMAAVIVDARRKRGAFHATMFRLC
jgi:hypothetical protein